MNTKIFYMTREWMRDGTMGSRWLMNNCKMPMSSDITDVSMYTLVGEMEADMLCLDDVFHKYNTDIPNNLRSMCVGDIIQIDDICFMVDSVGFIRLDKEEN